MNNLLYICFNRPDLVRRSLPPLLELDWDNIVILCDGPRNANDRLAIAEIRDFVIKQSITYSFHIVFRDTNLGCRRNIEFGLSSFFNTYGEGWVFEDDILLSDVNAFREFRSIRRHGHVSLYNHLPCANISEINVTNGQYFIWGWYLNTNEKIDFKLRPSYRLLQSLIRSRGLVKGVRLFFTFVRTLCNFVDTWDSIYRCWAILNKIENTVTGVSLIQNIGFDHRATHTHTIAVKPLAEKHYHTSKEWNKMALRKNPNYIG